MSIKLKNYISIDTLKQTLIANMEYETCKILISKGELKFTEFIKNILTQENIDLENVSLVEQRTNKKVIELFYTYPLEFKNCHIHEILKQYENFFIINSYSNTEPDEVIILMNYYLSHKQEDYDFLENEKKLLLNKIKIIDNALKNK
jgi:hypothetical protein